VLSVINEMAASWAQFPLTPERWEAVGGWGRGLFLGLNRVHWERVVGFGRANASLD